MISVVIPNYNGLNYLPNCISSLYNQSLKPGEIIIVDNNSTDGSLEFIKENYPDIILISLKENYGFSRAVNEGILKSKNPFVVLLNNDTEAEETWLENLYKCISARDDIFSCSSKMLRYDHREIIDDAGDGYTLLGWSVKHGDGKNFRTFSEDREIFSSCAGAAIYRREVFQSIGYFDESFFAYLEDIDIGYRAKIHGYKNMYASKAVIYHKGSGTSGSRYNSFKTKLVPRNNILLIYKNMPVIQLIINLPFILLGYFIKLLFFSCKSLGKDYIQGIVSGLKLIKKTKKVSFNKKNLRNYFIIQWFLIKESFALIIK